MVDNNERSSLWGILGGGALLAGGGATLYQSRGAFGSVLKSNTGGVTDSAISAAARGDLFNTGRMTHSAVNNISETTQQMLHGLPSSFAMAETKTMIKQYAYESLMSSGRISHGDALTALSSVEKQSSNVDAYKAAIATISKNKGNPSILENQIRNLSNNQESLYGMYKNSSVADSTAMAQTLSQISYKELGDINPAFAENYSKTLKNISAANVGDFHIGQKIYKTGDNTPILSLDIAGNKVNVPLSDSPVVYEGSSLSSRYTPRQGIADAQGNRLSFRQMREQSIIESLTNAPDERALNQNISNINKALKDSLDASKSAKAAIWTMPENVLTSGGLARNRLTLQEAVNFGNLSGSDLTSLIGNGYYPFTSPNAAAKGTLSTTNIAERLYGPLGNLIDPSQRPLQPIRSEWGATEAAKAGASPFDGSFGKHWDRVDRKIKGSDYESLLYGGASAKSGQAYSSPQLMTFYAKPDASSYELGYASENLRGLISAEEGVVHPSASRMLESERVFQKKVLAQEGFRRSLNPQAGDFAGIEAGTGKEFVLSGDSNRLQSIVGREINEEGIETLYVKEKIKLSKGEYFKRFGEDTKSMYRTANDVGEFSAIGKAAGLQDAELKNIEQITSGKLVGRNKMALANQQIEALSYFAGNLMDTDKSNPSRRQVRNKQIQSFLENPIKDLGISELMASGKKNAELEIQKNLISKATGWGLSEREMQLTFGLLDAGSINSLKNSGYLSPSMAESIANSSGVFGLGKGFTGDVASGSFGRGSFEQSGFRIVANKNIDFATELTRRTMGVGNISAMNKMEESVYGQESFIEKMKRNKLEAFKDADGLLLDEGKHFDLGRQVKAFGGSSSIYVPGMKEAENVMASSFPGGKEVQSPLMQELKSFQSVLKRGDQEEIETAAGGLRNAVLSASEQQSANRGKILGSSINTAIRGTQGDTIGLSKQSVSSMYDDLIKRSSSEKQTQFLQEQLSQLNQGQSVSGAVWRHPTTGPESFQFMKYRIDPNLKEGIMSVPDVIGNLKLPGKESVPINLSPMIGMQGDFDRDQLVVAAISNKNTQTRVTGSLMSSQNDDYTKFLFNHYMLNDKIKGNLSKPEALQMGSTEALRAGYQKLTAPKVMTGQVNTALQKFKLGVQYAAPESYQPLSLLFQQMEQTAISKHDVFETDLYKTIGEASKVGGNKGQSLLSSAMRSVFGENEINMTGEITDQFGKTRQSSLSMNIDEMAGVAMRAHDSVRDDVDIAMRAARTAKGEGLDMASLNSATEQFFARKRSVDVSQTLLQAGAGIEGSMESKASRLIRKGTSKATSILGAIKANKKPLLYGAAAAAGLMLMAPSISGSIPGGGSKAAMGLSPDDLREKTQMSGKGMMPPPQRMNASPRVYDIGSEKPNYRANIRTRTSDFNSSSFTKDARSMGGNTNIRTRDDRSILDPRRLAQKIHERF